MTIISWKKRRQILYSKEKVKTDKIDYQQRKNNVTNLCNLKLLNNI